jgi:hypothetical protein
MLSMMKKTRISYLLKKIQKLTFLKMSKIEKKFSELVKNIFYFIFYKLSIFILIINFY